MRYLMNVAGLFGMLGGFAAIVNPQNDAFSAIGPPTLVATLGSHVLIAGAVFLALGLAACDIVAAIEKSSPAQTPGTEKKKQ